MVATPGVHAIAATVVSSGETIVLRVVVGPGVLLEHSVGR